MLKQLRHIGILLSLIYACLITTPSLAQNGARLQPFTAEYHLNRGRMLVGKVTNTLRLEADGSYSYTSITKPVGLVAAFSDDLITETSKGRIINGKVVPTTYTYRHERKKKPKFRKQQFDWPHNKLAILEPKPIQTIDIPNGTQDKASMTLAMMQAMAPNTSSIKLQVADKTKLKEYTLSAQGQKQIKANNTIYNNIIKLAVSRSGKKSSLTFWLAPELNYLPVQIEKPEKKDTYTMTLLKYTPGQPAAK